MKNGNQPQNDRRDIETNGLGRRHYDVVACPFFDREKVECREIEKVKKELSNKLPIWVFRLFAGSVIATIGIFLALGWNAFNSMNDTYKKLDNNIHTVKESVIEVKTNQRVLMEDLGIRRFSHGETDSPEN